MQLHAYLRKYRIFRTDIQDLIQAFCQYELEYHFLCSFYKADPKEQTHLITSVSKSLIDLWLIPHAYVDSVRMRKTSGFDPLADPDTGMKASAIFMRMHWYLSNRSRYKDERFLYFMRTPISIYCMRQLAGWKNSWLFTRLLPKNIYIHVQRTWYASSALLVNLWIALHRNSLFCNFTN